MNFGGHVELENLLVGLLIFAFVTVDFCFSHTSIGQPNQHFHRAHRVRYWAHKQSGATFLLSFSAHLLLVVSIAVRQY